MVQKIGILGAGSWGTAIAQSFAQLPHLKVVLWDRSKKSAQAMEQTRINQKYFPDHTLHPNIKVHWQWQQVVQDSDVIILALPTSVIPYYLDQIFPHLYKHQIVLNASKGLDHDSGMTFSEMIQTRFGLEKCKQHYGVFSGPSFALEVMNHKPTGVMLALSDSKKCRVLKEQLHHPRFQVFDTTDIKGVEIGGALKNVIAITIGASDVLDFGLNSRAALLTKGQEEISQIGIALGAQKETFWGLSGIGDLILTCTGDLSRNRRVGMQLAQGLSMRQVLKNLGQVAEGIRTTKTAYHLTQELKLDTPILQQTYFAIFEGKPLLKAVETILSEMK